MKLSLSVKTLFRSPVRTILTFILLGLVSFAFFMRVGEYAVIRREFNRAASQYRGVGAAGAATSVYGQLGWHTWSGADTTYAGLPFFLETDLRIAQNYTGTNMEYSLRDSGNIKKIVIEELRNNKITGEQITEILGLKYVSLFDTRYMTAGISEDYYRLDDGAYFYNYTERCVVEGTLGLHTQNNGQLVPLLYLDDRSILAGNSQDVAENENIVVEFTPYLVDLTTAESCPYTHRAYWLLTPDYKYDQNYVEKLVPGDRYVVVFRFESLFNSNDNTYANIYPYKFNLSDYLTDSWCEAIQSVEGEPENYLELDRFSSLSELVEITNADVHTFDVVYTEDLNSIMRFSESDMMLVKGRALTREDSENGSQICVISNELSNAYELDIGDAITLKLGTELFEQFKGLGAVAVTRERYSPPVKDITLEIVGIYSDTDGMQSQSKKPHWSYSINTVFVPKSLLPVGESALSDHEFTPAEFSFMIDNAWDIPAFLTVAEPLFEELGLGLIFNDGGWSSIAEDFRAAERLSIASITTFSVAVLMAVGFTVYLFIMRKKKEYAIMRALGTPKKESALALVVPLMSIVTVSILGGSGAAWYYSIKTIERNNALQVLRDFTINTSIPAAVIIGCVLGELLLSALFAFVMLGYIGFTSPLALLQGGAHPKTEKGTGVRDQGLGDGGIGIKTLGKTSTINDKQTITSHSSLQTHHSPSVLFVLRYIGKHVRCAALKSVLVLLLAALLFCTFSQIMLMRRSYDDLFNNTVITARVVGELGLVTAARLAASDYTKKPYFEAVGTVEVNYQTTTMAFTPDISKYTEEEVEITYADGYDETCMHGVNDIIIVGKSFFDENGLKLGESILISRSGLYRDMRATVITQYMLLHPDSDADEEEILENSSSQVLMRVRDEAISFTIAGFVAATSEEFNFMLFSPGTLSAEKIKMPTVVERAEYTVADNEKINAFREEAKYIMGGSATDSVLVMDTGKIENISNTRRLLDALYPMAVAAALLIGAFLCCLTILQSSKEAAIMRVLGTTRLKTRTMLSLEQIMLSIVGLAIGICVLLILRRQEFLSVSGELAVFAAMYAAVILASAAVCSTLATRRSPLELLQTKE